MTASAELRRLRYLQAMGMDVFVSRRVLPGARATRYLRLREPVGVASPPADAEQTDTRAVGVPATDARAAVRRTLDAAKKPAARAPQEHKRPRMTSVEQPVAAAERFSLAAVVIGSRLWLEDLDGQALARDQVQLMAAIGRALDHPDAKDSRAQVGQFNWPMLENSQLTLGPDEASAALDGFLSRQLSDHGCSELMCLGERAEVRLQTLQLSVPVRHLPASRELLAVPERKRALWQSLSA